MLRHLLNSYKPLNTTNAFTPLRILPSLLNAIGLVAATNTLAFGVHIAPDDVVGSFVVLCEPQKANLWNYCPYFERDPALNYND
jgi:hypothetical protein